LKEFLKQLEKNEKDYEETLRRYNFKKPIRHAGPHE
jgi:hypothetical protein